MSQQNAGMGRMLNVILAAAMGLAVVGFVIGIRPMPKTVIIDRADDPVELSSEVLPGMTYKQLRQRRYGLNSMATSDLDRLRGDFPGLLEKVVQTAEQKQAALLARAAGRAYDGAPPVVPHAIDQQSAASCLACHASGIRVAERTAPVVSHPPYANCTQCHAPSLPRLEQPVPTDNSAFVGMTSPGNGERAWQGAPPIVPHRVYMREDCTSCHGVTGATGLRTSHPNRQNCVQCHVPGGFFPWD